MKTNLRLFLGCFLAMLITGFAYAQERTVSGKVTGLADGGELPGVNVILKGTTSGAVTDVSGNYKVTVPAEGGILVFSYIGYLTQEIEIGNQTTINISLEEDVIALSEVVVTAGGIEREKKALGYSVEKVGGDKVQQVSEPDPLRALSGKVAGVNIQAASGAPGSSTRITIRGNSSLTNDNQPLFVVDGVPYNNDFIDAQNGVNSAVGNLTGGGGFGSRISDLDPNNIESMTVLKGAAAAALYGSRAANGVILITTKTGATGASKKGLEITLNSSVAFEQIANIPEYQNSYGTGTNFAYQQANGSWGAPFIGARPYASRDSIPHWYAGRPGWNGIYDNVNVPYQAYPDNVEDFFETGTVLENSVTISGGNEYSNITAVLSHLDQEGFIPNTEFKRSSISIGGRTQLDNGFSMGASLSFTRSNQDGAITGVGNLGGSNPTLFTRVTLLGRNWDMSQPFQNPTDLGSEFHVGRGTGNNPYWTVENTGIVSTTDRYIAAFDLGYDVLDWLNLTAKMGVNGYTTNVTEFQRPNGTTAVLGQINTNTVNQLELNTDFLASASRDLGQDFTLNAHLGVNINQRTSEGQRFQGTGYVVFDIDDIDNTNAVIPNGGIFSRKRIFGVYGDATVGFRDYAFVTVTGRNDWSSTLPEENRSFFYPAVTGSVILTDALGIQSNVLSALKVRGGWSQVGNDTNPYLTGNVLVVNSSFPLAPPNGPVAQKPFLGNPGSTIAQTAANPTLQPEITSEWELGFESKLFDGRIGLDFTYYSRVTKDQIINPSIPEESGFAAAIVNLGEVSNKGVELGLDVTPIRLSNGFEWNIYGTYTQNKNVIEELGFGVNEIQIGSAFANNVIAVHREGEEFGMLLGSVDAKTEDGDLLIDPSNGQLIAGTTRELIGNPNPDFIVGLTNTFSWKGLTLRAVFDWKEGGDLWSNTAEQRLSRGVLAHQADREQNVIIPGFYGDPNTGQPILDDQGNLIPNTTMIEVNTLYFGQTFAGNGSNEWNVYDATVYRLRELYLGYTFPNAWLEKTPFGRATVSVVGRNLWYLAPGFHEDLNFDPETNQFGGSRNNQGIEFSTTPSARRFAFNISLTF